jgi:hypothetical protein
MEARKAKAADAKLATVRDDVSKALRAMDVIRR